MRNQEEVLFVEKEVKIGLMPEIGLDGFKRK